MYIFFLTDSIWSLCLWFQGKECSVYIYHGDPRHADTGNCNGLPSSDHKDGIIWFPASVDHSVCCVTGRILFYVQLSAVLTADVAGRSSQNWRLRRIPYFQQYCPANHEAGNRCTGDFTFVGSWNNYFVPALVIQSKSKMTVPILIATLRGADYMNFDMGKIYMMITVAIVPIIIVYLLLSKFIIAGVTLGGVKE